MTRRGITILGLLAAFVVLAIGAALSTGAESVSWGALWSGEAHARMIFSVRAPRVFLAALVGAVLAMSGATYQNLLRNPLADPFVLGVSGGAACAAAIASLVTPSSPAVLTIAAFAGAVFATVAVFLLARRGREVEIGRMIVAGLVMNSLFSAAIMLALSALRGGDLSAALRWMMGAIPVVGWSAPILLATVMIAGWGVLQSIAPELRMLEFGEEDATARGVRVDRVRLIGYATSSLMTGAAVALSGVIGFVGLLVPFIVRAATRSDYRLVLPASMFGGALLLLVADAFARTLMAPSELPLGALLAFVGAPFFVWMLRRQ